MKTISIFLILTTIVVVTAFSYERQDWNLFSDCPDDDALNSPEDYDFRYKRDTEQAKTQGKTATQPKVIAKPTSKHQISNRIKNTTKKPTKEPTKEPDDFEETEEQYRTKRKGTKQPRWTCYIHPTLRKHHSTNFDPQREKFYYDQYLAAGAE